jgi:hypothetical protein
MYRHVEVDVDITGRAEYRILLLLDRLELADDAPDLGLQLP